MAAIKTDGTLWTWGLGSSQQLGNTLSSNRSTPVTTFAGGTNWRQVVTGGQHTVALRDDGINSELFVWGLGTAGRLGNANTTNRSTPITTFAGGTNWADVEQILYTLSSGTNNSAALKADGTLWTWGGNIDGELGNASTTNVSTPLTTFAGGTNWKQISCGGYHTAAIKTDGTLWTWGRASNGELGNATIVTDRSTPVTTFAGGTNWKQVSSGFSFTSATKTDGTLWVWGSGGNGRLGNGVTTGNISTPVTTFAGGTNWKQAGSSTGSHMMGIKTDGTLWTWGNNSYGQLGNANTTNVSTPITTFIGGTNWKQTSAGISFTAATKTDGTLWLWGRNGTTGRLGTASIATNSSTPVTTFAGGTNWKQVSCGDAHTAAIKTDGTLWTWGYSDNGQLGNNQYTSRSTPVTTFAGGTNWKQVHGGDGHTIALSGNELFLFGSSGYGQIGNAQVTTSRSIPLEPVPSATNWKSISCGYRHSAAIKTDGTLWVWGNGSSGQLGNADTTRTTTPVTTFIGGTNWKQVSSGQDFTAAIKTDGTLWTWGNTSYGRLGNAITQISIATDSGVSGICNTTTRLTGTSTFVPSPNTGTRITTSSGDTGTVTSIANSLLGAASLTADTTVTSGTNDDGYWTLTLPFNISYNGTSYGTIYVGTNSYVTFNSGFTVFDTLSTSNPNDQKIMISSGDRSGQRIYFGTEGTAPNRTYRVRFEGSTGTSGVLGSPTMLWEMVFYENATSQIDIQVGINNGVTVTSSTSNSTPVTTFAGGTNWKQVSCGQFHVGAIKTDGTLWTWGEGVSSKLGNANITNRSTPVTTFSGGTNWKQVSATRSNTLAIKTDGTLWTWGEGDDGRLGNANTSDRSTPVTTFAGGTNWKEVGLGPSRHGAAIIYDDPVL
jgi:alpha-tubulin suppressor-like RCC1 family protein